MASGLNENKSKNNITETLSSKLINPLDVLVIFESTLKQESSYSGGPSCLLGD